MKRIPMLVLVLVLVLVLGLTTGAEAICILTGFNYLPFNTSIFLGPLMYFYAVNYVDVGNALIGGAAAWNGTDAAGFIGGFGGNEF